MQPKIMFSIQLKKLNKTLTNVGYAEGLTETEEK